MTTQESRDPGEFWSKVLSASKVKRVLRKRGFDPESFRRDYEADTSRGPPTGAIFLIPTAYTLSARRAVG